MAIKNHPLDTNLLTRLQSWYQTNCDGDWEHTYGISVDSLDNPGWRVKIDLTDTCLENLEYAEQFDNGTFDWLFMKVSEKVFEAAGDPTKLTKILQTFLDEIIPKYANAEFEYDVYVQLLGGPTKIWRLVKAKMVTEDTLQICSVPELQYSDIITLSYDDLTFEKEDIFKYRTNVSIGDNIKTDLIKSFNGVTLVARD